MKYRDGFQVWTRAPHEIDEDYMQNLPASVPHAFFIQHDDLETLAKLRASFILSGPFQAELRHHPRQNFVFYMTLFE